MSEEDGYDILYRKYIEGSALVKKYRQKITALRAENERLKKYNRKLLDENIDLFNDRNKLRADKRELVEACEKAKFLIESPATSFMDSIRKRAMGTLEVINELLAKHREK